MDLARSCAGILRIIYGIQLFNFAFGIIGDDDFDWPQDREPAQSALVQIFANGMLKDRDVSQADVFGDANMISECTNRFGGHSTAANARNGWQTRVIPTGYNFVVHQLNQLPFGNNHVTGYE